jgi:glycosyltransferase involved in cell wall biosynthesis
VRAHGLAARRAGFDPHLFFLAPSAGVAETEFGVAHRVAVPSWAARAATNDQASWHGAGLVREWWAANVLSPYGVALFAARLGRAVAAFLAGRSRSVVHGFYTWAWVGVRMRREWTGGVRDRPVALMSAYTAAGSEIAAKAWAWSGAGARGWLAGLMERVWIRAFVLPYERRAFRRSDRVLVNYESVRRLLAAAHGAGAPVRRLNFAAERAFRAADAPVGAARPGAPPRIVSVSRHDPRKGLDVLIQALAKLRRRGTPFAARLTSGGPLLETHRRLAARLGLGDMVTFTGWIDDPWPELLAGDLFVLPSLHEGSGSIALLEAMQAGCAIVASRVDGIPEDVRDGEDGVLFPPGDAEALAAALARLLSDRAERARLGAAARAAHRQRFSADAFAAALGEQYEELLAES